MAQTYIAFNLNSASRLTVLQRFQPKFEVVKADHITYMFGVGKEAVLPPDPEVAAIAYVCDESLEALIVRVNGSVERPDGSIFHLTLSRKENRKSSESNILARARSSWVQIADLSLQVSAAFNESH